MRKGSIAFIFVTLFIDVLGFGLLIPVMPSFIASLAHVSLSVAARPYGILIALYGAMQFLFSPMLGNLSDRFGRRPVLLLSLFFNGVDYVVMACAPSLPWLFLGRLLSGIAGASFTAASAYIADISTPENRSVNFGVMGAAFGIGFIIGPSVGGLLGQIGHRVPFWAAAILCMINVLYGYFVLPESLEIENRRPFSLRECNPFKALALLKRYPVVWSMVGCIVATNLGDRLLQGTWVLVVTERFRWTQSETGFSLTMVGVLAVVFQVWLGRYIIPAIGDRAVILIGIGSAVLEMLGIAIVPNGWMIYAVMIVTGMNFLYNQATQGLLSKQVPADQQGALQGTLASLASLSGIVGPVVGTQLFAYFTSPSRHLFIPAAPFYGSAVLYFIGLLVAAKVLYTCSADWRSQSSSSVKSS
jgi:DHA1 family tetracycline resistance protein-like MFS transporter